MSFFDIAVAIFSGNMLTVVFVWGCMQARHYKDADTPWLVLAALAFPLFFFIATVAPIAGLPPSLDALAAR